MTYVVSLDEHRAIAVARFHGTCSLQNHREARDTIAKLVRAHSVRRVLVDLSESTFPDVSTLEQYSFAESLSRSFVQGTRVAITTPRSSDCCFRFPADVAFNRGISIKTFAEGSQAVAWLLETEDVKQESESETEYGAGS